MATVVRLWHKDCPTDLICSPSTTKPLILLAPFDSNGELANTISVVQIKVRAKEIIAGTYDFADSGIQTSSVSSPSNIITLTLSNAFTIPATSDYTKNRAIIVLAPGTYTDFTVEYTLKDSKTGVSGTVSKTYNNLTLNAGRNRIIKFDLGLDRYEMKYYMWDTGKDYWDTYTGPLPAIDGEEAEYNGNFTNRDANWDMANLYATHSCAICPNANEASLYAFRGDPHWDETTLWIMNGHLYTGGMWFLKLQYCTYGPYTSPVTQYPDGHDYRQNEEWKDWDELNPANYHDKWVATPAQGKSQAIPANISTCRLSAILTVITMLDDSGLEPMTPTSDSTTAIAAAIGHLHPY